jgi:hypothetical protein
MAGSITPELIASRAVAFVKVVMPGLVPGIHVFLSNSTKDVDGRDKPGHDEGVLKTR